VQPSRFFRAGVGAVIANDHGQVLACERRDIAGSWQFPQGGLKNGEAPLEAVRREILEETGITADRLRLMSECPDLMAYELPKAAWSHKTGRGQVQRWFLFEYRGKPAIVLPPDGEFIAYAWRPFEEVERRTAEFRRPVYKRLRECFNL
jgi:putative (di)nucleoside polyphosphate hydrolase